MALFPSSGPSARGRFETAFLPKARSRAGGLNIGVEFETGATIETGAGGLSIEVEFEAGVEVGSRLPDRLEPRGVGMELMVVS